MKKEKLRNIEKYVEELLREDELARKDDCYLIFKIITIWFPKEAGKTFSEVMFGAKSKGICFESITRARRKIQRKYPELRDDETAEARDKEQEEYKAYAREG